MKDRALALITHIYHTNRRPREWLVVYEGVKIPLKYQVVMLGEKIPPNYFLFHVLSNGFGALAVGNFHLGNLYGAPGI